MKSSKQGVTEKLAPVLKINGISGLVTSEDKNAPACSRPGASCSLGVGNKVAATKQALLTLTILLLDVRNEDLASCLP